MKMLPALPSILALLLPLGALADEADTRGAQLYEAYCTQCHGVEGTGNGLNQPALSVQPRNHRDTGEMSARTDEDLFKAVKHGGKSINKSVLMPAWGNNLSDEDIHALVLHMRQLCCESGG